MARIRSVKPEFFTSISNSELSRDARLHFVGLWTIADDDGRAEDEPRKLKAAIWPLDDDLTPAKVEKLQAELEDNGKIVRYEVAGRRYFAVQGWTHQKIDRKTESKLPPPPERGLDDGSANEQRDDDDDSPSRAGAHVRGSGSKDLRIGSKDQGSTAQAPAVRANVESAFEEFWTAYPPTRRVDKAKCLEKFRKHTKTTEVAVIVAGARRWRAFWDADRTEDRYIVQSTRWLNEQRWETPPPQTNGSPPKLSNSMQALANSAAKIGVGGNNGHGQVIDIASRTP